MERDPVCGMMVEPERAKATEEHAGKTYYFCCAGCAAKFKAEPQKYLNGNSSAAAPLIQLGGIEPAAKPTPATEKRGIRLPDGSGSSPEPSRRVPEVWDG